MKEDIRQLINRFFEGQTSPEDEAEIMSFFADDNIPADLQAYRDFFSQYFGLEGATPDAARERLERQIGAWNMVEKTASRTVRRRSLRWAMGIAASLLLLIGVGVGLSQKEDQQSFAAQEDTYSNPRDAYEETRKALVLFSESLNKGLDALHKNEKKQ